ncbi:MAG TPA: folylpolyglutamate synthase/dihydrofolate synthase family protein [Clostridia bacterium]|nr:folylpolyglutamate synthase/dihydrofolate synthase family protein [Clostridia bacterium]
MLPYSTAVDRLYELGHELYRTPSHKFDLAHMRVLLEPLGNPERRFPSALIAGTNGKGSTAATLASILRAAGHRTGLYTSPHLVRINERIRINGEAISDGDFAAAYERVEDVAERLVREGKLPWHPSFFEMLTAMCFEYFGRSGVQVAVLEVGMGGRLDATNVVEPCVSVITDIALDHQKYLGDTIGEIAKEKAGIFRRDRPAVTLPQHPEANDVLGRAMIDAGAKAVNATRYMPPMSPGAASLFDASAPERTQYCLTVMGREIFVDSPLVGRHQIRNLALAISTAEELSACGISVNADDVERGVRETQWPARFQFVAADSSRNTPDIVLDVAHNPAGAWALRSALSERFPDRRLFFVFGAMRDKAIAEVAEVLFPLSEHVAVTTAANNPRSATAAEVAEAAARTGADLTQTASVADALNVAFTLARDASAKPLPMTGAPLVVITGSIYIVGEAIGILRIG